MNAASSGTPPGEVPNARPAREVGPGGVIRFAVGSPTGSRSSTWRVWSAKHTTDVYLAPRAIIGVQKISLHSVRPGKTGLWSHSFVSDEKAAPFVSPGASRHVDLWQRPPEFGQGWRRGYSIIVPWTELRPWRTQEHGDIVFAPHPGHGHWVYIEIVFVAAGTTTRLVVDEMHAIGTMALVDGSEAKVIARRVKPTREEAGKLAIARDLALAELAASQTAREKLPDRDASLRISLHGEQQDGTRYCFDLALVPPPPKYATICTSRVVRTSPEPVADLQPGESGTVKGVVRDGALRFSVPTRGEDLLREEARWSPIEHR